MIQFNSIKFRVWFGLSRSIPIYSNRTNVIDELKFQISMMKGTNSYYYFIWVQIYFQSLFLNIFFCIYFLISILLHLVSIIVKKIRIRKSKLTVNCPEKLSNFGGLVMPWYVNFFLTFQNAPIFYMKSDYVL